MYELVVNEILIGIAYSSRPSKESITRDPLIYTMDLPICIVSNQKVESISSEMVNVIDI